ncbi:hypothetical protein KM043_012154 [Ampulex compressa]|nr:hypothetical protein KM043_012154 [Ampulex compressa]
MQRPAPGLPWRPGELAREVPGTGRRSVEGQGEEVRGNLRVAAGEEVAGGGRQTLLEICITTPRGGEKSWRERRNKTQWVPVPVPVPPKRVPLTPRNRQGQTRLAPSALFASQKAAGPVGRENAFSADAKSPADPCLRSARRNLEES